MSTKTRATIEDLYKVEGKAELVHGEIVCMSPTGWGPGRAAGKIYRRLADYEEQHGGGYAFPDNVGFIVNLPHRESFSPDAAWWIGAVTMKFFDGAPAFAVEVRSEGDYGGYAEKKMARKRADYFAAGTRVVWDVDLLHEDVVRVFRDFEPTTPTIYRRGEIAEAEPALPGWTMPVDDIFK